MTAIQLDEYDIDYPAVVIGAHVPLAHPSPGTGGCLCSCWWEGRLPWGSVAAHQEWGLHVNDALLAAGMYIARFDGRAT